LHFAAHKDLGKAKDDVPGELSAMQKRFGNDVLQSWKSKSQLFLAEKRVATKKDLTTIGLVRRFCQTILF